VVYVRDMEDTTLTLIVSGKLWRNSLIMQDNETGTLWSHVTGEALDGPMKGRYLETIPSVQATWAEWVSEHPGTQVLKKEQEVLSSRYERYFKDPDRAGMFNVEWLRERLPGKSIVYGVVRGPFAAAVTGGRLESDPLANIRVGEDPVVVFLAGDGGVRAYVARADSIDLHFKQVADTLDVQDEETGSTWDLVRGVSTGGDLGGIELEEIKVLPVFWFAWSNFYPKTDVVDD
jgi:hypothetical protein